MTKMEAYAYASSHGSRFIANVVLCHYSNPAKKLKGIARLLMSGKTVSLGAYSMDHLLIDGRSAEWSDLEKKGTR